MSLSHPITTCCYFFYYCFCNHRHLHSFPTRRSSDLIVPYSYKEKAAVAALQWSVGLELFLLANDPWRVVRSEEHTSELQSQFHLVCRLLLEKKKNHLIITKSASSSLVTTSSYSGLYA